MTRGEAIRTLQFGEWWDFLSDEIGDYAESALHEALNLAIAAIREQEERRWIPVAERLPEAGGYVACIAKRNPFSRFMPMVARIEKNGWVNPITEQYISEVTNWMPIPSTEGLE